MGLENIGIGHIVGVSVSRGFHYYWMFYIKPILIVVLFILVLYVIVKILKS
jgi:hypothetical protein